MTADHPSPPPARWTPRLAAALVDLVLVTVPISLALVSAVERFTIVGVLDERARFSPADQLRIDAMGGGLGRGVEWNGSLYALSFGGLITVAVVTAIAALIVAVVLPTATGGRTPGKVLFGLTVVANEGPATMSQHALRTVSSPIDLFPWFFPGLLAVVVAGFDPNGRRLGDRLAGTVVVPAALPRQRAMAIPSGQTQAELILLDRSAQLDDGLAGQPGRPDDALDIRNDTVPEPSDDQRARPTTAADQTRTPDNNSSRWYPGRGEAVDPAGGLHIVDQPLTDGLETEEPDAAERGLVTGTAGGIIDLVFPESSLAESPLLALAHSELRRHQQEVQGRKLANRSATQATTSSTVGDEPVWNQSLEAWLYCEPASGQWFRHDPQRDRWEAVGTQAPS